MIDRTIRAASGEPGRLSVGFILAPRFTLCAFANFIDVLRLAADEGDRSRPISCRWAVLSDTMAPITASCGVRVQPDTRLGRPRAFDYIVVVGGLIDEIPNLSPAYGRFLRQAEAEGVPLAGVCTGAFILHRMGLMEGYRCCVSWFHHADFLDQFDGLTPVSDQIFIADRDRLTCSGGVSSAHLAAFLVERHVGHPQAGKSLRIMIIDEALHAEQPQPAPPGLPATDDPLIRRAMALMQQNIDTPRSIASLSHRLGVGRRRLERHFSERLGRPPAAVYMKLRLDHAAFLLRSTGKSTTRIAADTGFCDAAHFARRFRAATGLSPSAFRRGATAR